MTNRADSIAVGVLAGLLRVGGPIRIEFSGALKPSLHASTFIRQRRIVLDIALLENARELQRILIHEMFHFVWLRIGNKRRKSFEDLLCSEAKRGVKGELGWSAEWRKDRLKPQDRTRRTRRWREYACESFCDTAAWLLSGTPRHQEFTLSEAGRAGRRAWFGTPGLIASYNL